MDVYFLLRNIGLEIVPSILGTLITLFAVFYISNVKKKSEKEGSDIEITLNDKNNKANSVTIRDNSNNLNSETFNQIIINNAKNMKVNLEAISENVSTQYGDLTGVIQIDTHSLSSDLYDLCKDYGFNTNDLFIVGFELQESTISGIGDSDNVCCTILYVNKSEYGNSFDTIVTKIKLDSTLKLKKKTLYIKYSTLGKYIKRYHFMATSELTKYAENIEFVDDNE